jgi:manganese/zinc/iron transport system substrate-binding protein
VPPPPSAVGKDEVISAAGGNGIDPHLWMDASLWRRTAPVIATALAGLAPDCADAMQARARDYGEQLDALHGWIARSVATIPERRRVLVTAHDAFGYYGRAYGIRVVGIQGISTESEAGVADIRAVADLVVERGIPAIFVESTINPRTIRAVVEAVAQRGREVAIGGQLHSDALGEEGTVGGTYVGMLYENTTAIVTALGGRTAPLPDALRPWAGTWNVRMAAD